MKKNLRLIIYAVTLFLIVAVLIALSYIEINFSNDGKLNGLLKDVLVRALVAAATVVIVLFTDAKEIFKPFKSDRIKRLLWCLPCALVVVANFPFSALIGGKACVMRVDLIPLFAFDCLLIGITEEILFRGLLQYAVSFWTASKKYSAFLTVLLTSLPFGLIHLCNVFSGASIGGTLLQAGYCFLVGAMLSAVMLKTNDVWICAILHILFNFGGNLIPTLGSGEFQDALFWIFTAVAGVLCLAHVLRFLVKVGNR